MKVEVEAAQIVGLEQQAQQAAQWLTVALSKLDGQSLTISPDELAAVEGALVKADMDGDNLVLTVQMP